ncbi:hypothetical protein [Kaistia sp. MMO-174]|uniref:hypothetical protein n=1 Tax=Kaistia sp. MMO-174 TaxID=3081256 RepID=UPI00301A11E5
MLSRNLSRLATSFERRMVSGSFDPESAMAFLASLQVAARQAEQMETAEPSPTKRPVIAVDNVIPFPRSQ